MYATYPFFLGPVNLYNLQTKTKNFQNIFFYIKCNIAVLFLCTNFDYKIIATPKRKHSQIFIAKFFTIEHYLVVEH